MSNSRNFFDNFASQFDSFYDGKRGWCMRWIDQRFRRDMFIRYRMTFDFLGELNDKSVLDIGCGSGPYMAEALNRGALEVTGIDPAPNMLALAKQKVTELGMLDKAHFVRGYFPQTIPQRKFDFAIVMGVMDYIEDALSFLSGLSATITVGAAISFPSTHWLRSPVRKLRYQLRKCPLHLYTHEGVEALLNEVGFTDYEISKIPGAGMDYFVCVYQPNVLPA